MVLGKVPVRGVLQIWIRVGAGGVVWPFFSRLSILFSFSLGDDLIWTEILSHMAVKPKTTNQPIKWWPLVDPDF